MKITFSEEELRLLVNCISIYDKSKQQALDEFVSRYNFEMPKIEWFDTKEEYLEASLYKEHHNMIANTIISKLNQMSDKNWNKYYKISYLQI